MFFNFTGSTGHGLALSKSSKHICVNVSLNISCHLNFDLLYSINHFLKAESRSSSSVTYCNLNKQAGGTNTLLMTNDYLCKEDTEMLVYFTECCLSS